MEEEATAIIGAERNPKTLRGKKALLADRLSKLRIKADDLVHGVRDHVRVGQNIRETVKGKLCLGKTMINSGGFEGVFRKSFSVEKGEKMVKASHCYLSTTGGPLAGVLFVSTLSIAFCSEKTIEVGSSLSSESPFRVPYKVLIPLKKIKGAFESENIDNPDRKYVCIVTADGFEFWFMGFVNYKNAFACVQKAIFLYKEII